MAEIRRQICVHWTSADTLLANECNKHFHARKPVQVAHYAIQKYVLRHKVGSRAGVLRIFAYT